MNNARNTAPDLGKFHGRRIAVTGATGMLGSHLVAELLRAGYTDITLPVRDTARIAVTEAALRRLGVHAPEGALKIIETPLTDPVRLDEKVRDIDTVFNCAARIMSGDMTTEQLIANNVAIARSVTNWCLTTGVRKLIHVSSISALGNPTGPGLPVTEECDPESVTDYAAYGQSKYYSEQEVRRGAAAGLPTVIVSPGVILGEGDTTSNNSAALIPAISCGQPFYTEGLMSYVDVRDVARAMVLLDAAPQAVGERFILSAGDLSYRELITLGARAAHRPRPFIRIGKGAVDFAYGCMRTGIALHLIRDRGVTRENLGSVLRTTRYDGSKITRYCDFAYTPLPETVERVVAASRNRKKKREA